MLSVPHNTNQPIDAKLNLPSFCTLVTLRENIETKKNHQMTSGIFDTIIRFWIRNFGT